jgi:hypothetical protein
MVLLPFLSLGQVDRFPASLKPHSWKFWIGFKNLCVIFMLLM